MGFVAGPAGAAPVREAAASVAWRPVAVKLAGGADLKKGVEELVRARGWKKAVVLTGVGSLKQTAVRFAEKKDATVLTAVAEVLSLTGTVTGGEAHLHVSVAPADGQAVGGHLMEGALVNGIEVVVAELPADDAR